MCLDCLLRELDDCTEPDSGYQSSYSPSDYSSEAAALDRAMTQADKLESLGMLTEKNRSIRLVTSGGEWIGMLIVGRTGFGRGATS